MLYELGVILLLVLLNGLFAGTEMAVVSLERGRFLQLLDSGSRRARAVAALRNDPERFFATVQIGITVVGATAGAFGGATFARDLEPVLERIGWFGTHVDDAALAVAVIVVSFLSLVLGELVPKSLALRYAEPYALFVAPALLNLSRAARPLVWVLTATSNLVLKLFRDQTTFAESRVSSDELQQLVDEAKETGSIHPGAGEIASRAIEFAELTAADVMVPRARVVGLGIDATKDDMQRILLEHGFSRLPVYRQSLDDVIGYAMVKDMLALAWEGRLIVLQDLIRPPYFVVASMRAPDLLQQMRERRIHMAIVVDERGGTAGLVTIEDLLEELVGEIFSEHAGNVPEPMSRQADGSLVVEGDVPLREVNRALDIELPEGDGWTTVGGLCMALAERVPRVGETLTTEDGSRLQIEAATDRVVGRVRVWPKPKAPEELVGAAGRSH
jgi:putative hemolysin